LAILFSLTLKHFFKLFIHVRGLEGGIIHYLQLIDIWNVWKSLKKTLFYCKNWKGAQHVEQSLLSNYQIGWRWTVTYNYLENKCCSIPWMFVNLKLNEYKMKMQYVIWLVWAPSPPLCGASGLFPLQQRETVSEKGREAVKEKERRGGGGSVQSSGKAKVAWLKACADPRFPSHDRQTAADTQTWTKKQRPPRSCFQMHSLAETHLVMM